MRNRKQLIACGMSFALLLGMTPTTGVSAAKKVSLSTKKLTISQGTSKTLKVKNAKKTVKWKILSGKKYITLKKKGKVAVTIKGKKKGTAKVQATVGKTKLTCKVTVKDVTKQNTSKPAASTKPVVTSAPTGNPTAPATPPTDNPAVTTTPPTDTQTPPSTPNPTTAPTGSYEQDVEALQKIIAEQRGRGATVSEDLNSDEYKWKGSRLTEIAWSDKNLSGALNLSECTALLSLDCVNNKLSSLDVTGNVKLEILSCEHNQLNSLDVSSNVRLTRLSCGYNQLNSLDVSKNVKLWLLSCEHNQLSSLDVSSNVNLHELYCEHNQLDSLDLTNNTSLTNIVSLSCDDTVTVIGYSKTPPADMNEQDVAVLKALIAEQQERGAWIGENLIYSSEYEWENGRLVSITWDDSNLSGNLDVSGLDALQYLGCHSNQLTGLDVSKNVDLMVLDCQANQLSSLDVSKNVNLAILDCRSNQLSSLDVSKNVDLSILSCEKNQLSNLDLTNNTQLMFLTCDDEVIVTGYKDK